MFLSFEGFCNNVKRNSSEKMNYIVFANNVKNTLRGLISIIVAFFVIFSIFRNGLVALIVYMVYVVAECFIMGNRKVGLAVNDKMMFLEYFTKFGYKAKELYDIPYDKIKYISVYKFLGVVYIKVSFVSYQKRFEQLKIMYSLNVLGLLKSKQKENGMAIYEKLVEVQKVIDRGDF